MKLHYKKSTLTLAIAVALGVSGCNLIINSLPESTGGTPSVPGDIRKTINGVITKMHGKPLPSSGGWIVHGL